MPLVVAKGVPGLLPAQEQDGKFGMLVAASAENLENQSVVASKLDWVKVVGVVNKLGAMCRLVVVSRPSVLRQLNTVSRNAANRVHVLGKLVVVDPCVVVNKEQRLGVMMHEW